MPCGPGQKLKLRTDEFVLVKIFVTPVDGTQDVTAMSSAGKTAPLNQEVKYELFRRRWACKVSTQFQP